MGTTNNNGLEALAGSVVDERNRLPAGCCATLVPLRAERVREASSPGCGSHHGIGIVAQPPEVGRGGWDVGVTFCLSRLAATKGMLHL